MKVCRRIATLTFAALLSVVVSATAQTVNISSLTAGGPYSGTGFGNTQTVVSNQYGYFATYVQQSDVNLFASTWRLVRSTDGGVTFTTVYEGVHGTPTPAIETDRDGNIYLIHSDSHPLPGGGYSNDAYFLRFLVANNYTNPTVLTLPGGAAQKFSAVPHVLHRHEWRAHSTELRHRLVLLDPSGWQHLFESSSDTGGRWRGLSTVLGLHGQRRALSASLSG
jgi:hypothetical protein